MNRFADDGRATIAANTGACSRCELLFACIHEKLWVCLHETRYVISNFEVINVFTADLILIILHMCLIDTNYYEKLFHNFGIFSSCAKFKSIRYIIQKYVPTRMCIVCSERVKFEILPVETIQ